jgi:hypothetical protein
MQPLKLISSNIGQKLLQAGAATAAVLCILYYKVAKQHISIDVKNVDV